MARKSMMMLGAVLGLLALAQLFPGTLLQEAAAQAPTLVLRRHTFGNAGGRLAGGNLVLNATLGQPSVAGVLNGSTLRLSAGYWAANGIALPGGNYRVYLPLVMK